MRLSKRDKQIRKEDPFLKIEQIISENEGGSDVPDAGDVPGGILNNTGEDLLSSVYTAWREQVIAQQIERWMKTHRKKHFP